MQRHDDKTISDIATEYRVLMNLRQATGHCHSIEALEQVELILLLKLRSRICKCWQLISGILIHRGIRGKTGRARNEKVGPVAVICSNVLAGSFLSGFGRHHPCTPPSSKIPFPGIEIPAELCKPDIILLPDIRIQAGCFSLSEKERISRS